MKADTIDLAALKERAIYLTFESCKADRAGAGTMPVHQKQAAAMDAAVHAGIPMHEIADAADDRLIQYILDSRQPGYQPSIDYNGDGQTAAA
ncbi:hypothetical protein ABZT43_12265 [Streptomyces sp. NPDC005349]|uniref:hypothetical protein n=1 Tax=Streptomyces sp. NPDC005349 TaxID=3157037 RepID=UPI0033A9D7EE